MPPDLHGWSYAQWAVLERLLRRRHALVPGFDGAAQRPSPSTIGRIWRKFELRPHRQDSFKLSRSWT